MAITVAVCGAGRMGALVARQLPGGTRKLIIDTDIEKARLLAAEVGGTQADSFEAANEADLIALVIPAPAITETVEKVMGLAKAGAIIINLATSAHIDAVIKAREPAVRVIEAKIIGHAASMAEGNPGIVVVDTADQAAFNLIRSQLPGFQEVVRGDADLVPKINELATAAAIRIAVDVRKQLRGIAIPESWITVALKTICAGVVKAFAEDDLGDFGQGLVRQLEQEDA